MDREINPCDGCKLKEECEHMRQYKGELPHNCPRLKKN